jgi:hypothetical protein
MYSRFLQRSIAATSQIGSKVLASPFHLKPQPGLLAFAKNNESGIVVGVYSKTEIPRHQDFDIQIKVRGGEVVQVSHSALVTVQNQNSDLPDDYLEMLSLAFPYSEMLPKVHPR